MCRLLETIRVENGHFNNLKRHIQRMNQSRKALYGCMDSIDVEYIIQNLQPLQTRMLEEETTEAKGLFKCRIEYGTKIEKIEFLPYQKPAIRTLQIVTDNELDYSFKYLDRKHLDHLYTRKGACDDILIVKNGLITDSCFANILFYNGKHWITPAHPLLKGTQRQYLLETGRIELADIRPADLKYFQKARLVNAMILFEDKLDVHINNIKH